MTPQRIIELAILQAEQTGLLGADFYDAAADLLEPINSIDADRARSTASLIRESERAQLQFKQLLAAA